MSSIKLLLNNKKAYINLFDEDAPKTINKIKDILPQTIDLHYAKFAGQEVFGMLPIFVNLENARNVNNMKQNTVVFYPEKQLFCIYYGELQEEDANVTVIGELKATEEFIDELEEVRYNQGIRMIIKNTEDEDVKHCCCDYHLKDNNMDWHNLPHELDMLLKRNGIMQPGGPIIYAEAETRKLADLIWLSYGYFQNNHDLPMEFLEELLKKGMNMLGGWCGLKDTAKVINQYLIDLKRSETDSDINEILKDFLLYVNRLNMWLDLLMPWDDYNESIKKYNRRR